MADLIDREVARDVMYHNQDALTEYDLDDIPSVDAAPVVHGRWEYLGDNSTGQIMGCTYCQKSINPDKTAVSLNRQTNYPDYCPNCGAKMDWKEGRSKHD